ncbi:treacle protein-like [Gymnodraco acuticeps]|uniref:Treacle protein-like n=1 Tax=Gymnodraco acuticeps TaxID=8218 RepID=A0A6P8VKE8_GYMAC|nr:treacle protein-like [Gymnodraco acuticeps]
MASEEDATLLFLIFQHLKVHGYKKAAKVLEKHIAQVETPEETPNLHEIYSGWMKLYSLAQDAKQEAEDGAHLKKNGIKPEPATSEEEDVADAKLNNITQENHVDAKPPAESRTDVKESAEVLGEEREEESVSEQLLPPAGETKTTDPESEEGEKKEEETIAEEQSAPVEEAPEAAGEEVEPRAAICDQPDAALTPGEEQRETQESEAATDEASALEQTAVNQTEASEEGEGSAAEQTEPDLQRLRRPRSSRMRLKPLPLQTLFLRTHKKR